MTRSLHIKNIYDKIAKEAWKNRNLTLEEIRQVQNAKIRLDKLETLLFKRMREYEEQYLDRLNNYDWKTGKRVNNRKKR